jgi:hypothetical protein
MRLIVGLVAILSTAFETPALARQLVVPKGIVGIPVLSKSNATHSELCLGCFVTSTVDNRFDGIFGGGLEVKLKGGFSVEADALYQPRQYQLQVVRVTQPVGVPLPPVAIRILTEVRNTDGHSWDFPVFLKKKLGSSGHKSPYVLGGYVPSRVTGTTTATVTDNVLGTQTGQPFSQTFTRRGVSAGGGMELKFDRMLLFPEGRFTHWIRGEMPGNVTSNQSLEFMLGISLGK